ncbi:MAG: hypothetical protein COT18_02350 [Elusimicrobia bacterium CG08_land_8_20_14_0_20_59_10]|nr:MAG: hypothetical protein COT18_02350 [Elusimicrobia bacterium CG08_land_8_20_14_0_20_59_10]
MKRLVVFIIFFSFFCGIVFILVRQSKAAAVRGVLSFKMAKLVSEWDAQGVTQAYRKVTMVVSDTEIIDPVVNLSLQDSLDGAAEPSGWGGEMTQAEKGPSAWKKLSSRMNRTFFRGSMAVVGNTEFSGAFSGVPDTLIWCHRGTATVSEEEMEREFVKAVLKASEAGAEVRIVTHGYSAAPALKAVNSLKDVTRAGRGVFVSRLVAVNMNRAKLRKLDPVYFRDFTRMRNLNEWVNIWPPPSGGGARNVEILSPSSDGVKYSSYEILQALGVRERVSIREIAQLAKELVQNVPAMEQTLAYWKQAAAGVRNGTAPADTGGPKGRDYQREAPEEEFPAGGKPPPRL